MNKKYTTCMILNFDITRRCNMRCDFCAKGDAQNQDITREIINKAFDEVQDFALDTLRLFGGEPFLCPDIIRYIFNQIIERRLMVGRIYINTNGTIRNENIRDSLIIISKYFLENKNKICDVISDEFRNVKSIDMVISTIGHNISDKEVEKTLAYYNVINESEFSCRRDTTTDKSSLDNIQVTIQGNAEKNHVKLLNRQLSLSDVRIKNNKFDFIWNYNYNELSKFRFDTYIHKTLTVCTDGSVYIGCSTPWKDIKNEAIFNIAQCNGDFLKRINDYCWKYPVNEKIKELRERYAAIKWCNSHGYELIGIDAETKIIIESLVKLTYEHEEQAKQFHKYYPEFNHIEINNIVSAIMPLIMKNTGFSDDFIKFYMTQCTRIPQDVINTYNQAYGEEYFYSLISDTLQRVSKKKNDNRQFRIFGNINQGFSVSRR